MSTRAAGWSTVIFIISVVVAATALVVLASMSNLRFRFDATKSRAYSLSEQSRELLDTLEGDWTVAVVLVESQADPATVRQVDEVLDRFAQAGRSLAVQRIDPTQPESLRTYESLLIALQDRYREDIKVSEATIGGGIETFQGLIQFCGEMAGPLRTLAEASSPQLAGDLGPRVGALSLLAGQGNLVIDEVKRAMQVDDARPLPDFEAAIAILVQGLSQWSEELDDTARLLAAAGSIRAAELGEECSSEAARLAIAADRLKRLPDMELSRIGRHLQTGEAAIVLGPDRASVIPAGQLFAGAVTGSRERVSFDRRFRGEQLFSSAIRSLVEGVDPTVIFVHAEERSMLQSSPQNIDVSGAASMLEAGRIQVLEWPVTSGERPLVSPDSPAVWIVLAPARRTGLKPAEPEMKLLRTVSDLLADGEPVMLSLYPSLLQRYGQADPWAELVRTLGVDVRTGEVVSESQRGADGETNVRMMQVITEFTEPHPIAAALHGQALAVPLPIPIGVDEEADARVSVDLIGQVSPSTSRWLESSWSPREDESAVQGDEPPLEQEIPVIAAIERPSPVGDVPQRVIVTGSGGWMLNYVADMVMATGGDRYALLYPGNHELLLSGSAWLAGLDDRIAPGPLSQEVARLGSIPEGVRFTWTWVLLLGLPGLIAVFGIGVWTVRRS